MSKPLVTETVSGYQADWRDEGIRAIIDDIHNTPTRLTGWLTIRALALGDAAHLSSSEFNFRASTARQNLVKLLTQRYTAVDWYALLEQLSVAIVERLKRGEPVIEIDTTQEDSAAPEYMAYPYIVKNYPNVLFGDPGASKSQLAMLLAAVVSLPWYDNPCGVTPPPDPVRVLYLDWEVDDSTARYALKSIERGHDLGLLSLHYRHCDLPLYQDVSQVRQHISDTSAGLLIIDSLGIASGGDLNKTDAPLQFYSALRRLHTTSLILAHNSKDPESRKKSIYGSMFYTAQSRNVWEVVKVQDPGDSTARVSLFHRKPPPFSGLLSPRGLKLDYSTPGKVSVSPLDPASEGEFLQRMTVAARIKAELLSGEMTSSELANSLELKEPIVAVTLKRMCDKGHVQKTGTSYSLPP